MQKYHCLLIIRISSCWNPLAEHNSIPFGRHYCWFLLKTWTHNFRKAHRFVDGLLTSPYSTSLVWLQCWSLQNWLFYWVSVGGAREKLKVMITEMVTIFLHRNIEQCYRILFDVRNILLFVLFIMKVINCLCFSALKSSTMEKVNFQFTQNFILHYFTFFFKWSISRYFRVCN